MFCHWLFPHEFLYLKELVHIPPLSEIILVYGAIASEAPNENQANSSAMSKPLSVPNYYIL